MKEKELTNEMLIEAAKDLNDMLGLEPEIDIKSEDDDLKDRIIEAGEEVLSDDDLKDSTWDVLRALGVVKEKEEPEPKKKEPEKQTENKKEKKQVKKAKKEEQEVKPKTKPKAEVKPKAETKQKVEKKKQESDAKNGSNGNLGKYTRGCALLDAITKKPKSVEEIIDKTNEIAAENGLKENLKQSEHIFNCFIKEFLYAGIVEEEKGKFKKA